MSMLSIMTFALLGVTSIFFQIKNELRLRKIVQFLFFASVSLLVVDSFAEENKIAVFALLGVASINLVLSHFLILRKPFVRLIPVGITVLGALFMFKDVDITFLGEANNIGGQLKFVITGLLIAIMSYDFGKLKLKYLNKFLGGLSDLDLMNSVMIFLIGIAYFLSGFGGGMFGIMLLAAAHLSSTFYRDDEDNLMLPLNLLMIAPFILHLGETTSPILLSVDVVEGLFFGVFASYFLQQVWYAECRSMMAVGLAYFIGICLSLGILMLATQFEQMGGVDALLAFLIGVGLHEMIRGKGYVGVSLSGLVISASLFFAPLTVNELEKEVDKGMITLDGTNASEVTWMKVEDLKGDFTVLSDSSKVVFEVIGKDSKSTKGVFNDVQGVISILDDLSKSTFDITLPMNGFTTNNKYRDESLHGADYFNVAKFPTMKYTANGIVSKGNGEYELKGTFTMIGVSQELTVQLKRPDVADRKILVGSGVIDRTKFGMSPSEIEGNIVNFNFQVELIQK